MPHISHQLLCELLALIIMEICKAPTLRFKALNKHSITHIVYIEMENVIRKKGKTTKQKTTYCRHPQGFKHNYAKDAHTHTHTHTHQLFLV